MFYGFNGPTPTMAVTPPPTARVFGSTFSPNDVQNIRSRVPAIPQQGTFDRADARFIGSALPPYQSSTKRRIMAGAVDAGFDFGRHGGILPRAVHALNNRRDPSNLGAIVAQLQGHDAVMAGFYGVAGLGASPGCTSTGAQTAMATLNAGGQVLTATGGALAQPTTVTSPTGQTMTVPSTTPTRTTTALAISGAATSLLGAIYTGVCTAKTGTTPPAVTTATQVGATTASLISDISAARAGASAASTPATSAATAAATNPNSADAASATVTATASGNKTLLYVGIGAAALIGVALVLRK